MDDNDFVMDALFAEVKRLNADLQEEDAKEAPEGDETMEIKELIQALRADAEWAHANEWETPITLGDHLDAAADALAAVTAERDAARERLCYTCNNGNPGAGIKHSASCDICPWSGQKGDADD